MKELLHIPARKLSDLGIVEWGYTDQTTPLSFDRFETWSVQAQKHLPFLLKGKAGAYRSDLKVWYPQSQAALVFLFSYAPTKKAMLAEKFYKVAGYSLGFDGKDYHPVLKERLHTIARMLQTNIEFEYKFTHDTEPVLERDLAFRAGLGWFGKNSMLIHRQHGSYFLIGSLILDRPLELTPALTDTDHCGQCRLCVDQCPTAAIDVETRTLFVEKCISTWTIEDRSADTPAPAGFHEARGEVFGCDICQDVCPWNQKPLDKISAALSDGARHWMKFFQTDVGELAVKLSWMTNRGFLRFMENTVFARPGRPSLLRTLAFWMKR